MSSKKNKYIKSPLNYNGSKYKLLPQILPLFPENINTFVDLFCGGLNVAINVKADNIIANDIISEVIDLYEYLKYNSGTYVVDEILEVVDYYDLSKTNKDGYLNLRKLYNEGKRHPIIFYTLLTHAFNNQIRFNKKGEFNMPFGKNRISFNDSLLEKMKVFTDKIDGKYTFSNLDFRKVDIPLDAFVYVSPPNLVTTNNYNESGGWTQTDELDLLNLLDGLDFLDVKFALSSVLEHGGKENSTLKKWSEKYKIHYLNVDYGNCNYQKKNKDKSIEVLITNY